MKVSTKNYLKKLYTNLENNPSSFSSVNEIYKVGSIYDPTITLQSVQQFLSTLRSYALYKPKRINYKRSLIIPHSKDHTWASDSVYMLNLSSFNRGFKYLIIFVDIYSKYVFARPLKTLHTKETSKALEDIVLKTGRICSFIWRDAGTEYGKHFKELCNNLGVKMYATEIGGSKSVFAERFIRTLKNKFARIFEVNNTYNWIDSLDAVIDNYNNKPHTLTKIAPSQVLTKVQFDKIDAIYTNKRVTSRSKKKKYRVGDYVRVSLDTHIFAKKSMVQNWSEQMYVITRSKYTKNGLPGYYLKDLNGEHIKGLFYEPEISSSPYFNETGHDYIIDKIITIKGSKAFVSFRGYPSTFNTWIPKKNLTKKLKLNKIK